MSKVQRAPSKPKSAAR
jgi:hypothetical protein